MHIVAALYHFTRFDDPAALRAPLRAVCEAGAERLARFFGASVELMQVLARACGHDSLSEFGEDDLTSWKKEMAELSGVRFAGVG